jgi:hypothetical protein
MIHLPASVRVYLCLTACDMRNYAESRTTPNKLRSGVI